jgi:ABC-type uncharacterized transport system substrate-binding protein
MKQRSAAVSLLTLALLATLGWIGEGWAQTKIARVGILTIELPRSSDEDKQWWEPFRRTLAEQGWIDGKNVSFEFRNAHSDSSQLVEAAAELVRLKVDVIWAPSAPATRAVYAATRTIPIVAFDMTTDPVAETYVETYGRPGGNLTGVFLDAPGFAGKWLELQKAIIPGLSRLVVLWDPSPGRAHLQGLELAARSIGVQLEVLELHEPDDIDRAFAAIRGRPQGLIILPSPLTFSQSERLARLALKHRLPATSMFRRFAEEGGALAYGPEFASAYERCAVLVAKILRGAKPAELSVERPTKVQLIVNLKTTKALGLRVPDSVLVRADEVIR